MIRQPKSRRTPAFIVWVYTSVLGCTYLAGKLFEPLWPVVADNSFSRLSERIPLVSFAYTHYKKVAGDGPANYFLFLATLFTVIWIVFTVHLMYLAIRLPVVRPHVSSQAQTTAWSTALGTIAALFVPIVFPRLVIRNEDTPFAEAVLNTHLSLVLLILLYWTISFLIYAVARSWTINSVDSQSQ